MAVRAERALATRERIIGAARELFDCQQTDFTLEMVARKAGTSVQTVIRAFGNKDGLLSAAIGSLRDTRSPASIPTSPEEAVTLLFDDYEEIGDRVIRLLAEEHRNAAFGEAVQSGRDSHKRWVSAAFAPLLEPLRGSRRQAATAGLIAATDVYIWKLLRRDLGVSRDAAEQIVLRLITGVTYSSEREI